MEQITIEWDQKIVEQVSGKVEKSFVIGENATMHALFIVREAEFTVHIEAAWVHSNAVVTCIFLSKNAEKVIANVTGNLAADHAGMQIYLLSLLSDNADCQIDGGVTIAPNILKASGHLHEENIVLGKKVKIKTLPMLDVRSADVSASHGATIDRLDEWKLFYMMARGLDKKQSQQLIVRGYIERAREGLENNDDIWKDKVISDIMTYLGMN